MLKLHRTASRVAGLLVVLGLALLQPVEAVERAQTIQDLRTTSYSLLTHVLIYYNPGGTPYDAVDASQVRDDLARLRWLSADLGNADVVVKIHEMAVSIERLEELPQSVAETRSISASYDRVLLPLIEQFNSLETIISSLHADHPEVGGQAPGLNALSHDLERLQLSYQLATFQGFSGASVWILDEQTISALDESIQNRLVALKLHNPQRVAVFEKVERDYQFVRKRVLQPSVINPVPNAVGRYLLRAARTLDAEVL